MTQQKYTNVGSLMLIALLCIANRAACQDYSGIVVFGSSIEDVGNAYEVTPDLVGFAATCITTILDGAILKRPKLR